MTSQTTPESASLGFHHDSCVWFDGKASVSNSRKPSWVPARLPQTIMLHIPINLVLKFCRDGLEQIHYSDPVPGPLDRCCTRRSSHALNANTCFACSNMGPFTPIMTVKISEGFSASYPVFSNSELLHCSFDEPWS